MKKDQPYVDKDNNTSRGVPMARRKMMTYFQFSLIALIFVVVFAAIFSKSNVCKPRYISSRKPSTAKTR